MASTTPRAPRGLDAGGRALWRAVTDDHTLDGLQLVQLTEACRAKDRLDRLDKLLTGDTDTWATLVHRTNTDDYELRIDSALAQANATATVLKQLLAALRLPDGLTGNRPQRRGAPRGAYQASGQAATGGGKASGARGSSSTPAAVSSLDRARARQSS